VDLDRGIDGNKKIKGRKEHIVVDTLGLPMSVVVHQANTHDSVGAHDVIDMMKAKFPKLKKILADGGYKGRKIRDAVKDKLNAEFKVVLRPEESSKKFSVLPLRWIVERSFSWLENFRRIAMDYEFYSDTAVAMVQIAFCKIMLNKIIDTN
ncbi:MAG: IS5 family transposase, partial [Alistipes sp.]